MSNDIYADLAAWAENDMVLNPESTTALRGDAAAAAGRELLARAAGRRSSGHGEGEPRPR